MSTHSYKTWIEVSKTAISKNVKQVKRHVAPSRVMAVVKSNAYGHGLSGVARIADRAGADWFGVDNVDEGIELRRVGITKPILVLGYTLQARLADCITYDLACTAYNIETVHALARLFRTRAFAKTHIRIHIKIETGTTRQGISGSRLVAFLRAVKKVSNIYVEGVSTHFANIEDTTDPSYAQEQLRRFVEARMIVEREGFHQTIAHTACSAALILYPETVFDVVRLGVSLYGLWSSKETRAVAKKEQSDVDLVPALTWKTRIAQIKDVPRATPVSYGLTECVSRSSKIAVIPVGYWDGFTRGMSSTGYALVRGHRCKVIGRVCMNMCMIDVTDVPRIRVEDEVVLLGTQGRECISAEEIATKTNTINYEVVTRINPTLPRVYV